MNIRRLEHLCDVLGGVDPAHFNLDSWASAGTGCGTTACAVGYAALDPQFREEGLRLVARVERLFCRPTVEVLSALCRVENRTFARVGQGVPHYAGSKGWNAVCRFFDLTGEEAWHLFSTKAYAHAKDKTPGGVARRIRALIASRTVVPSPKMEPEVVAALA